MIPDPLETPTLSIPDAAELLGIGRQSGYAAARSGDLPTVRFGGRAVVPVAKLRRLLGIDDDPQVIPALDKILDVIEDCNGGPLMWEPKDDGGVLRCRTGIPQALLDRLSGYQVMRSTIDGDEEQVTALRVIQRPENP